MDTRCTRIVGLAALGLVIAAPVQAAPQFTDPMFLVAARDRGEEIRQDRRDERRDERRGLRRDVEREGPQGYGYGYERRQQQRFEDDRRQRDRR